MPKPKPPHLLREVTRHGLPTWYVRKGHGQRLRLRAEYDFRRVLDRVSGRAGRRTLTIQSYEGSDACMGVGTVSQEFRMGEQGKFNAASARKHLPGRSQNCGR